MEKTPVRQVLADNLAYLMGSVPDMKKQKQVAKKAGVAQTSVSQMLRPENATAESPKLTQVEKVARAFGLATWQLLIDTRQVGREMAALLMRPSTTEGAREQERSMLPREANVVRYTQPAVLGKKREIVNGWR